MLGKMCTHAEAASYSGAAHVSLGGNGNRGGQNHWGRPTRRTQRRFTETPYNHTALVVPWSFLEFIMRLSRRGLSAARLFSSDFVLANLRGNQ
jgi:hypothetical protein